jgi:hypothetical protein
MTDLELPPDGDRPSRLGRLLAPATAAVRLAWPAVAVARSVLGPAARVLRRSVAGSVLRVALPAAVAVRVDGRDVPVERGRIAEAFAGASAYVVILVPGRDGDLPRVDGEGIYTAVAVRWGSGRPVAHNGRALAGLIEGLVTAWPVEVERLALVGQSVGGLVARSALRQSAGDWHRLVRDVICTAEGRAWVLRNAGAAGEQADTELRDGYLDEHEWAPIDPAEPLATRHVGGRDSQPPRSGRSRSGQWVGDLLVLPEGARATPARRRWWRLLRPASWRRTGSGSG